MGVTISLRDGKISMACWIIFFLYVCLLREFWGQGERALGKHWEPSAQSQTHGVKYSVGPKPDNVGILPSTFHAKRYQGKEIALKC